MSIILVLVQINDILLSYVDHCRYFVRIRKKEKPNLNIEISSRSISKRRLLLLQN